MKNSNRASSKNRLKDCGSHKQFNLIWHDIKSYLVISPSMQKAYSQYRDSEKHTTATMTDMADTK